MQFGEPWEPNHRVNTPTELLPKNDLNMDEAQKYIALDMHVRVAVSITYDWGVSALSSVATGTGTLAADTKTRELHAVIANRSGRKLRQSH